MSSFQDKVNFIWSVADLIRDTFKRGKYQDVILPFTVLRRIDCVLQPTKPRVLETHMKLKGKLDNLEAPLRKASGFAFFNTSKYDFERLVADTSRTNIAANLRNYINGFSDNMREVLEKFDFTNTINKLDEADLLYQVLQRFRSIDLHPDSVSNHEMGYIFEELIRKFNEALDENPGEHFTPREVIELMVELVLALDRKDLKRAHIIKTVYDPCCGTGGMLTIAREHIQKLNPGADIHLFGQEVNPETYAVCKSDLLIKSSDGRDADNIKFGSTLRKDLLAGSTFDYEFANPPYGKEWKNDKDYVEMEAERGERGRFPAGTPRISDGQLLFLQHMLAKMNDPKDGGSRIAIVMNGSPLFTGDAGSGESEIRRYILEHDWLDVIVALPDQLFYNTGINTYIWVLTNRKEKRRKGKVQLIDASGFWVQMRKSLGNKRHEISAQQIDEITSIFTAFEEGEHSKIFDTTDFGYRKITIERPLRLNFQASSERIERLKSEAAFVALGAPKNGKGKKKAVHSDACTLWASGTNDGFAPEQQAVLAALEQMPKTEFKDRALFEKEMNRAVREAGVSLPAQLRKAIMNALAERDETAESLHRQGWLLRA